MPSNEPRRDVDRRDFLNGRWPGAAREGAIPAAEIASMLVQVRPEHLEAVAQSIRALGGCEIYDRCPKGKLVVVIEATDVGVIGATLNTISSMPHVLTAALVFHATDEG